MENPVAPLEALAEKPPSPQQAIFKAICEVLGWDVRTLDQQDRARIAQAGKILAQAGYTDKDLRRFLSEVWFHDWRWQKSQQRPTLTQLRQEIGKLRGQRPQVMPQATPWAGGSGTGSTGAGSKVAASMAAIDQSEQLRATADAAPPPAPRPERDAETATQGSH